MPRVFLAVEIPFEILQKIEQTFLPIRQKNKEIKWVKTENSHLTLLFLGEVEEKWIETEINPRLMKICSEFTSIPLQVNRIGFFPSSENPRIFWIGIGGEVSILKKLHDQMAEEFKQFPIHREEKKFHPHLTIGRIKFSKNKKTWEDISENYKNIVFGSFLAQEVVLFKSALTSQGAKYTKLKTFKLKTVNNDQE